MLRVGLTGGIGCGKSTVAAMMGELGCHIINADKMAHAVIAPGTPACEEIRRQFGTGVFAPDGSVDRSRLAAVVFADAQKLAALNAIVHPAVLRDIDRELERLSATDPSAVAVVEAALLPGLIGWGRTRELLYRGHTISAAEAERWGFLQRVEPAERLDEGLRPWLEDILRADPAAIRAQKRLIEGWLDTGVPAGIHASIDAFSETFASDAPNRRLRAFFAGRKKG